MPDRPVQELRDLVRFGLHVDNLRRLEEKSRQLLTTGEQPVLFYVLEGMFSELRMHWEGRAVTPQEHRQVADKLVPPIENLLSLIISGSNDEMISRELAGLVMEFVQVRSAASGQGLA